MNWQDIINGIYEWLAGCFLLLSCFRLYWDKEIKGWSLVTQIFFTTWAVWNIYFYWHLNQYMSFVCALWVGVTNIAWTSMAIHYTKKNKKKKKRKVIHG